MAHVTKYHNLLPIFQLGLQPGCAVSGTTAAGGLGTIKLLHPDTDFVAGPTSVACAAGRPGTVNWSRLIHWLGNFWGVDHLCSFPPCPTFSCRNGRKGAGGVINPFFLP